MVTTLNALDAALSTLNKISSNLLPRDIPNLQTDNIPSLRLASPIIKKFVSGTSNY
jgi:hypothetical protein